LPNEVKLEIQNKYSKNDQISDVKLKLELKFHTKFDYWAIYSFQRKLMLARAKLMLTLAKIKRLDVHI